MYVSSFYPEFSSADISNIGCLGSSHGCYYPDDFHALLDMG